MLLLLFILSTFVSSWDKGKFKVCKEKPFCNRHRYNRTLTNFHFHSTYSNLQKLNSYSAILYDQKTNEKLGFVIEAFKGGIFRLKLVEEGFHKLSELKYRLDVDKDVLQLKSVNFESINENDNEVYIQSNEKTGIKINKKGGIEVEFMYNLNKFCVFNKEKLLNVESSFYVKGENETFKDGERAAVVFDIEFSKAKQLYGIPERAMELSLPETNADSEPYRLFNLDIFEYELNNKIGLYGNVPFLIGMNDAGESVGVFYLNPSETFIDVNKNSGILGPLSGTATISTKFISSNGLLNVFFIPGPSPKEVIKKYTDLVGKPFLPPKWSIGYHQCRWNYKDEEDVLNVDKNFDIYDIPYDVIWLDIEHTDGKKYFTWDNDFFPTPENMQQVLKDKGRYLVTISDPHIKKDDNYFVYSQAKANNYFVSAENGGIYEGDCWPGRSSWLDFYDPKVRDFYGSLFDFNTYKGSTDILYTWIDMNEPSVFGGPEITMDLSAKHIGDVQHREIHNMYSLYHTMAAHQGHLKRANYKKRPFILTRSFFSGSQMYAAVWTGDNEAEWEHLRASIPMMLTLGIAGFPFTGADVGGFFKEPEAEIMERWYQLGVFYPFFRQHAHLETKRREPWEFEEDVLKRIRVSIIKRYNLYPYVYTAFYHSHLTGLPIFSPLFLEYPTDKKVHTMDDQFFFGESIMAKPVVEPEVTSVEVYFPRDKWYDYDTGEMISKYGQQKLKVNVDINKIPIFQKGGSIIPLKMRVRRASKQMVNDPYTLKIALDRAGYAEGDLFIDDGLSYEYRDNEKYLLKRFFYIKDEIISNATHNKYVIGNTIERIIVFGIIRKPSKLIWYKEKDENDRVLNIKLEVVLDFEHDMDKKVLVIKKPNIKVSENFKIKIFY